MLFIRKEQARAFEDANDRRSAALVRARIEKSRPHIIAALGDEQLEALCLESVRLGRRYRVTLIETCIIIALFLFELGTGFDRFPPITRVLKDESIPPDRRFQLLLVKGTTEDWRSRREEHHSVEKASPAPRDPPDELRWESPIA